MGICSILLSSVLLFGDSRCFVGYPTAPTAGTLLQTACPGMTVWQDCRIGRGVFNPGFGTFDTPAAQLTARLAITGPVDACLLDLGINDWHVTPTVTPEAVVDGLKELADICIAHGAAPVLLTGWPVSDGTIPSRGGWNGEVRQRTLALAQAMGWRAVDSWDAHDERTWNPCTVNGATPADGVHPWVQSCRQTWANFVAWGKP